MAFKPGTVAYIGLDNAAGAVQNVTCYADTIEWEYGQELIETTVLCSSGKQYIGGMPTSAAVPISGPADSLMGTQLTNMLATQIAGGSTFSLLYGPLGSVAGFPKWSAETVVTNIKYSNGVTGPVMLSAVLQVTGATTTATW